MRDQVDEVKSKTDIVAVIGEQVKLTKAGRNFKGLCPFHNEKSPSFMVSPELQIFKCFGCGESGDVLTFLEKREGMEFYEALSFLAEKAGIKLEKREVKDRSESQELIELNTLAAKLYHHILTKHKLGEPGRQYLINIRKLKENTIDTFQLGFAPGKRTLLFEYAVKKRSADPKLLEKAGLIFKTQMGYVDRFWGRVIFPISDHRGNVVALGGRILPEWDSGKVGKYINSPETPIYHKSRSLYGLNITKDEVRKQRSAILVEGEMDLLSSWQAGVKNIVAIKGTALTDEHIRMLSRFAETLILAFDTDFAGDSAAIRGITMAQDAGLELKVADMGEYKDPDEFAKSDKKGYLKVLNESSDAFEFVINAVSARYDLSKASEKARAGRVLVPLLVDVKDSVLQSHYITKIAQKLKVSTEAIASEVQKKQGTRKVNSETANVIFGEPVISKRKILLEERLLALGIKSDIADLLSKETLGLVEDRVIKRIIDELRSYKTENVGFDLQKFSNILPEELKDMFYRIMISVTGDESEKTKEYVDVKREIRVMDIKEKMEKLSLKIGEYEKSEHESKLVEAEHIFQKLSEELKELEV